MIDFLPYSHQAAIEEQQREEQVVKALEEQQLQQKQQEKAEEGEAEACVRCGEQGAGGEAVVVGVHAEDDPAVL